MGVPGASRFINASTLANLQNRAAQPAGSLLSGGADLLQVGRGLGVPGVGLSQNARALNQQQVQNAQGLFNNLFSSTIGATATVEGLQAQIQALRSSLPESRVIEDLRPVTTREGVGTNVDTTA